MFSAKLLVLCLHFTLAWAIPSKLLSRSLPKKVTTAATYNGCGKIVTQSVATSSQADFQTRLISATTNVTKTASAASGQSYHKVVPVYFHIITIGRTEADGYVS